MRHLALLSLAFSLSACGGDAIPPSTMDMPDLAMAQPIPDMVMLPDLTAPYPAPFPDPPQAITAGGPVLKAPKFVPIFFANDDPMFVAQVVDFVSKVGATNYWTAVTKEYGIGAGTSAAPIMLADMAPAMIADADIQTWLVAKLKAGDPFPAPDSNTVYVIHYPTGTTVTLGGGMGGGSQSCVSFGGYHSDVLYNGKPVAYAVVPRCDNFGDLTGIDAVTGAESHELVESVTDPYPNDNPAYFTVDNDHVYWSSALGGGEVGDLCAQFPTSFTKFAEFDYVVQRTWSNAAISAGHDPCVPPNPPNQPYFNAVPELPDMVPVRNTTAPGVLVPLNMTKTITLDLYSDSDTGGEWNLAVEDLAVLFGTGPSSFTFKLDKYTGRNGDHVQLTITTNVASTRKRGTFVVRSALNNHVNYWFGLIGE